jgi:hypothetical protein
MKDALVTVFQTSDVVLIALAKAALEAEQIPYVSQGKGSRTGYSRAFRMRSRALSDFRLLPRMLNVRRKLSKI